MALVSTPITQLFNIQHPVLLAGMGHTAGSDLVAAVSNAGGLGVLGGLGYTPQMLREAIQEVKQKLRSPTLPFGVDLLLPQLGSSARKTNTDYTKGALDQLVDIIIDEKVALFVSAVGTPPKHVVDRLHDAGIFYMVRRLEPLKETCWIISIDVEANHVAAQNMVGHPKVCSSEQNHGHAPFHHYGLND